MVAVRASLPRHWISIIATVVVLLLVSPPAAGQAPKKHYFKLHHVDVIDDGKTNPKPPRELKRFEKTLRRIGTRWEPMAKAAVIPLEVNKERTVKLPRKLGTAKLLLTLDPKKKTPVVRVTLTPLKKRNKKDETVQKYAKYPVILAWERLKVGPSQYTLILEKTTKPRPRPKK